MITRRDEVGTGSWGRNVLSWLRPEVSHRVVLRYEDLAREQGAAVEPVMTALVPQLRPFPDARVPSFADLQQADDGFFRRGITATHRDELSDDLHQLFWAQPDNLAAMRLLGYGSDVDGAHRAGS